MANNKTKNTAKKLKAKKTKKSGDAPYPYTRKNKEKEERDPKVKVKSTEITMSAVNRSQYPVDGIPEIALAGRSNVGKSSLINGLLNRKSFARTSQTPGKTRTINFYLINKEFFFVDLPGYGYAKVAKTEKGKWGEIMEMYLSGRNELCAILLLVDVRHEPTEDDKMMYDWIKFFGYNCIVVATKADKISKGQYDKHRSIIRKKLDMQDGEKIIFTSSSKRSGILDLWDEIVFQYESHGFEITTEESSKDTSQEKIEFSEDNTESSQE